MEMRAREATLMSEDLIPPIPPIAIALHDRFLRSRCSSCFNPLPISFPISCSSCGGSSISYCSSACAASDSDVHSSSGECRLLRLLLRNQSPLSGDSSDVRAALRLQALGLPVSNSPRRIGWLLADYLDLIGSEPGSEIEERIRQGADLMRGVCETKGAREEEVMWAVMTNAVEVQVGEGGAVGIGVYGPWFAWFNHSCSPNACYRFEIGSEFACGSSLKHCNSGLFRVSPARNGEGSEEWKKWVYGGNDLSQAITGLCRYGPRIIVRSIKNIKKGEEVCITYTDLFQPKVVRHIDLWSKYQFICCCERCSASPEIYADYVLNCDARSLVANHNSKDTDCDELAEFFDQTISEYMLDENPETCCQKLKNMLSGTFENSKSPFNLHPLHHLSLKAYIALSSAYKISSANLQAIDLDEEVTFKVLDMNRAALAYSLLLAGATHHLFMSEPSLIANAAIFWVNAGESIMVFLRNSHVHFSESTIGDFSHVPMDGLKKLSMGFLECLLKNLTKSWPYLVRGLAYLENIWSPIDFRWLGIKIIWHFEESAGNFCLCCELKIDIETNKAEYRSLARLAACCLNYGRFLSIVCWGNQNYLVDKVENLLMRMK